MCKRHILALLLTHVNMKNSDMEVWRNIYLLQVREVFRANVMKLLRVPDWPKVLVKMLHLIPRVFDSEGLRWGPTCSLSNNSPSEADVAGLRTRLWEPLIEKAEREVKACWSQTPS